MTLFARLQEIEVDAVRGTAGILGGLAAWWEPDIFGGFFLLLVAANAVDWFYGRREALYHNRYDRRVSRTGLYSKAGPLVMVALLRALEFQLPRAGLPDFTGVGVAASFVCLALIVDELESIEDHIVSLGGRRIPFLGAFAAKIRAVTGASRRVKGDGNPPGAGPRLELQHGESLGGDP